MTPERAAPKAEGMPARIGRYEIISSLGVGGMARVFLGLQRGRSGAVKLLAIKQVRAEIAADENFLAMFADEARIALRLSHPNVVTTFDVVDEAGEFFMVLEYLEGQPLSHVLRRIGRANMPLDEHLWILTQVLAGLDYAHKLQDFDGSPLGIVHRDVSPSNVFITYTGQVKLVDFGIAKASGALAETQLGIIKGKLGYAAPEQCLSKPVNARSDVYAVGVMLWEALAGRRRAVAETALATVQARIQDSEEVLEQVWPEVPKELARLTKHALAVDPEARFASAQELQRGLESYLQQVGRRAGQTNLASLMLKHFDGDMNACRRAVEEHVGATRASASQAIAQAPEIVIEREPDVRSFTTTGAVSTLASGRPRGAHLIGKRSLILGGLVALCAIALMTLFGARKASEPSAHSATPAVTLSAGLVPDPALRHEDSVGPTPTADADSLPPGTKPHPSGLRPRRVPGGGPIKTTRPAESSAVGVAPAPPTAPVSVEPGADLAARAASRSAPSRGIDEKDPYSK